MANIRRDLFSVKVYGNGFNAWCHERIFRSMVSAKRYKNRLAPMAGYSMEAKIVHPSQDVVDVYTASGNTIEN